VTEAEALTRKIVEIFDIGGFDLIPSVIAPEYVDPNDWTTPSSLRFLPCLRRPAPSPRRCAPLAPWPS
jgi:hypothetical protein